VAQAVSEGGRWSRDQRPFFLSLIITLVAAALAIAQGLDVRVTTVTHVTEPLAYANPSLNLKGTVSPAPGHRLDIVVLSLGATPVDAEVGEFALLAADGRSYTPIGVGGGAHLIFPLDRLGIGQEVGQVLPTDAIVAVTRNSSSSVTLEAGPKATIALLYEVPANAVVKSLRLPDGSLLAVDR
jgi:hypothetical protein